LRDFSIYILTACSNKTIYKGQLKIIGYSHHHHHHHRCHRQHSTTWH
jgi:hypothetical protein